MRTKKQKKLSARRLRDARLRYPFHAKQKIPPDMQGLLCYEYLDDAPIELIRFQNWWSTLQINVFISRYISGLIKLFPNETRHFNSKLNGVRHLVKLRFLGVSDIRIKSDKVMLRNVIWSYAILQNQGSRFKITIAIEDRTWDPIKDRRNMSFISFTFSRMDLCFIRKQYNKRSKIVT